MPSITRNLSKGKTFKSEQIEGGECDEPDKLVIDEPDKSPKKKKVRVTEKSKAENAVKAEDNGELETDLSVPAPSAGKKDSWSPNRGEPAWDLPKSDEGVVMTARELEKATTEIRENLEKSTKFEDMMPLFNRWFPMFVMLLASMGWEPAQYSVIVQAVIHQFNALGCFAYANLQSWKIDSNTLKLFDQKTLLNPMVGQSEKLELEKGVTYFKRLMEHIAKLYGNTKEKKVSNRDGTNNVKITDLKMKLAEMSKQMESTKGTLDKREKSLANYKTVVSTLRNEKKKVLEERNKALAEVKEFKTKNARLESTVIIDKDSIKIHEETVDSLNKTIQEKNVQILKLKRKANPEKFVKSRIISEKESTEDFSEDDGDYDPNAPESTLNDSLSYQNLLDPEDRIAVPDRTIVYHSSRSETNASSSEYTSATGTSENGDSEEKEVLNKSTRARKTSDFQELSNQQARKADELMENLTTLKVKPNEKMTSNKFLEDEIDNLKSKVKSLQELIEALVGDGLEKKADYSENHPFSRFRNKVKQTMNVVAASTCSKIVNEKLNDRSLIESMPWFKDVKSELVDVEKIKTVTSLTANRIVESTARLVWVSVQVMIIHILRNGETAIPDIVKIMKWAVEAPNLHNTRVATVKAFIEKYGKKTKKSYLDRIISDLSKIFDRDLVVLLKAHGQVLEEHYNCKLAEIGYDPAIMIKRRLIFSSDDEGKEDSQSEQNNLPEDQVVVVSEDESGEDDVFIEDIPDLENVPSQVQSQSIPNYETHGQGNSRSLFDSSDDERNRRPSTVVKRKTSVIEPSAKQEQTVKRIKRQEQSKVPKKQTEKTKSLKEIMSKLDGYSDEKMASCELGIFKKKKKGTAKPKFNLHNPAFD